jgi:hypothetical protein
VTLDYAPNRPVLLAANPIPVDLERFREYLAVSAAIKIKTKRQQAADQLNLRLYGPDGKSGIKGRVINMSRGRKSQPKSPAIPAHERYGYGHENRIRYPWGT